VYVVGNSNDPDEYLGNYPANYRLEQRRQFGERERVRVVSGRAGRLGPGSEPTTPTGKFARLELEAQGCQPLLEGHGWAKAQLALGLAVVVATVAGHQAYAIASEGRG